MSLREKKREGGYKYYYGHYYYCYDVIYIYLFRLLSVLRFISEISTLPSITEKHLSNTQNSPLPAMLCTISNIIWKSVPELGASRDDSGGDGSDQRHLEITKDLFK